MTDTRCKNGVPQRRMSMSPAAGRAVLPPFTLLTKRGLILHFYVLSYMPLSVSSMTPGAL
eukprot:11201070-Lingulodinium_polyedra.AAC.1